VSEDAAADRTARRQRLAQRRKSLGLTQDDLAGLLAVERSTVVRWERGGTEPTPAIQPRLAKALRVSADQLADLLAAASHEGVPGRGSRPDDRAAVPRQLPTAVADFVGRSAELRTLTRILDEATGMAAGTARVEVGISAAEVAGTVVISAIGGTAGVGKTALALHWAHRVAGRFRDGQLYVNLRGFAPGGALGTPARAVRGFLDALGVPPNRIPADPDAQAGLYRTLLADRQMLIVLDNARDEQQVRPLLPASPGSLVLITSRNQLAGLAIAHGARLVTLDVLAHGEAVLLLTARLGADRAAAEPAAVSEIADLCARLPLALAVAAARAGARPGFPLAALTVELRDAAGRLDALDAGDPAASVRAVFSWSYRELYPESARMFRFLGLHPGSDISVPAAASLAGTDMGKASRLLRELARDCLITEHAPGRFTFHDLLRAYAADQARATDSGPERTAAIGRVLDHYLHTAAHAALTLYPAYEPIALAPPESSTVPEQPAGYQQAMAWFDAEHHVLLTAALTAGCEFDHHAWQLPWAMMPYLQPRGHHQECAAIQRSALAAAVRLGDIAGQAVSSRLLAAACSMLGDYDQALGHYMTSLNLYKRLGDRRGETKVYHGLGQVAERQGHYADALRHAEQALGLYQAIGDKAAEAEMLNNIGWCHAHLGDYQQARAFCRQALARCAEADHLRLEGNIWDSLGYAEHHVGNFAEAAGCYRRALSIAREVGDRWAEADTLIHLGDTRRADGDLHQAREAWQKALDILDELQSPDVGKIRAKLADVND
jgi:tetratricopeptide (TPR) repeat protein/transcriptional regulator with XRE-family HTH domain